MFDVYSIYCLADDMMIASNSYVMLFGRFAGLLSYALLDNGNDRS